MIEYRSKIRSADEPAARQAALTIKSIARCSQGYKEYYTTFQEESAMLRVDLGRIPSLGNWNGGTATTDLGTIDLSWKWAEIEFWENSDFKKMLDEFAEVVAAHY